MEKSQHNREKGNDQQQDKALPGNAPGQQLPPGGGSDAANNKSAPDKEVKHSESSLPQNDNETLGTP